MDNCYQAQKHSITGHSAYTCASWSLSVEIHAAQTQY